MDRSILRLTPRMLAQSRLIAKGRRIRDVQRLVETYGVEVKIKEVGD